METAPACRSTSVKTSCSAKARCEAHAHTANARRPEHPLTRRHVIQPIPCPTPFQVSATVSLAILDGIGHGAVHTQRRITTMSPLPLTVFPSESEDIAEVSQADAILLKRLGMEALPAHETMLLPTERLIVVDPDLIARS